MESNHASIHTYNLAILEALPLSQTKSLSKTLDYVKTSVCAVCVSSEFTSLVNNLNVEILPVFPYDFVDTTSLLIGIVYIDLASDWLTCDTDNKRR